MNLDDIIHLMGEEELPSGSMVPPIFQTSNFSVKSIAELRSFFSDEWGHHLYTRGNNPTVKILRRKLAALEGTDDAICFSSGIAAVSSAIMSCTGSGDHVICVRHPYAWTNHLLSKYLPKYGVECTFVDGKNFDEIENARKPNTTVLMLESPNSMTFDIQDLSMCSAWAKRHGISTIIDNSYASPLFQNPTRFGIDMVVHSGSKYLNGHSDVVFGVVCSDRGRIRSIAQEEYMTLGAIMSPFESFLVLRGLRTLPVRMERIDRSTRKVFDFLSRADHVDKVFYPFDPESDQYDLARRQMSGCPGLLSIQLRTREPDRIEAFIHALKRFRMAVSWGGHESLVMPLLAAHFIQGRSKPSLPVNHMRLYIGLEDPDLLIKDLKKAFDAI